MKNNGFTLIELLAVIIILSIIALIASPSIIGLIDDARKEAFKSSAYGIIKAGEILYSKDLLNGISEEVTFTYANGVETSSVSGKELDYNGTKPKTGTVKINSKGQVAIAIHNGTYCTEKGYEESEVILSSKTELECTISFEIPFLCNNNLVDGRDNSIYKTVQIGEQCWMAENLKYTGNGCLSKTWDSVEPHDACATHQAEDGVTPGEYTNFTETQVLYQWGATMNGSTIEGVQGLCPSGWHVPTETEWETLEMYLGGTEVAGSKLKASSPIWNGSNTVGFNALPAGDRLSDGSLYESGTVGGWWTSTISDSYAWNRILFSDDSSVGKTVESQSYGLSIRCLLG